MILVHFQGKVFSITLIQIYGQTTNAEETEVEPYYEDLENLLELTPKKSLFYHILLQSSLLITKDCNCKVGSQELPRVIAKFSFGLQNEAVHRLTEFCQENTLVIANPFFQ